MLNVTQQAADELKKKMAEMDSDENHLRLLYRGFG